jgi:hypothetical protein
MMSAGNPLEETHKVLQGQGCELHLGKAALGTQERGGDA